MSGLDEIPCQGDIIPGVTVGAEQYDEKHKMHGTDAGEKRLDLETPRSNRDSVLSETETLSPVSRKKARIQFLALCLAYILAGWSDGTAGPLIPRIREVYNIGYTVVSMIFVVNCAGFVSGAVANVWLTEKLGFGKTVVLGSSSQLVAYVIQSPGPPFPVFAFAYFFNGFGMALQDAQGNGFVANLPNATIKMSLFHAAYGFGALCSPLVATQFAQVSRWSFHYLVSLFIAFVNTVFLAVIFRFKTQDECFAEIGLQPEETNESEGSSYKQLMKLKAMHLLALFSLLYVGTEVTIGGWTVTFMQNERGGGSSTGYVSTGFFAGLTLGRIFLIPISNKVGERLVLFIYAFLALGLELVVWLVPSLIGGAIAVSFVGVVLGPIYPIMMNQSARILPPWLLTGSVGWIAGLGQAGSALFPFITGALAGKYGIEILEPLMVGMIGVMIILWALVPGRPTYTR